ncbi:MAG: tetratricopeptide repeat protein [Aliifodinibius sp.]|nr:tetratricopeptide repeat protein [Fodinibius sp.]NIW42226.1 tetratricopeptide repeat protein [candidate division Zixibacteria bacterium]NIX01916.1 tetratricopeptide repeat protein [Phycisphaerae bacterium]NIY30453.1 tetratricopeptide repeat protein [Fodinibius sp.]
MHTKIEKRYQRAKELFEAGKVEQAISILQDIIAQDPGYLPAYYSLGYAYMERGENNRAEPVLLKLAEMRPDWDIVHLQLGKVYENLQQWEKALAYYQTGTRLKPDNPYARMHLGIMYQILNKIAESVYELQQAYQLGLGEFSVVYNLANGWYKLDNITAALNLLDKEIEGAKIEGRDLAKLHNLRGGIYSSQDRPKDAYLDFQKAVEISPDEAEFFIDLGDFYFEQGELERAINSYQQALNTDDPPGRIYKRIGLAQLGLGNWNAAITALEKAKTVGEASFYELGLAYYELYDNEKAIENFALELVQDGPAKAEANYYLGFIYDEIGKHDLSERVFKQFLELAASRSHEAEWRSWIAQVEEKLKDRQS